MRLKDAKAGKDTDAIERLSEKLKQLETRFQSNSADAVAPAAPATETVPVTDQTVGDLGPEAISDPGQTAGPEARSTE